MRTPLEVLDQAVQFALHQISKSRRVQGNSLLFGFGEKLAHFTEVEKIFAKFSTQGGIQHKLGCQGQGFGARKARA